MQGMSVDFVSPISIYVQIINIPQGNMSKYMIANIAREVEVYMTGGVGPILQQRCDADVMDKLKITTVEKNHQMRCKVPGQLPASYRV